MFVGLNSTVGLQVWDFLVYSKEAIQPKLFYVCWIGCPKVFQTSDNNEYIREHIFLQTPPGAVP